MVKTVGRSANQITRFHGHLLSNPKMGFAEMFATREPMPISFQTKRFQVKVAASVFTRVKGRGSHLLMFQICRSSGH